MAEVGDVHHGQVSRVPGAKGEGAAALGTQQDGLDGDSFLTKNLPEVILEFLSSKGKCARDDASLQARPTSH